MGVSKSQNTNICSSRNINRNWSVSLKTHIFAVPGTKAEMGVSKSQNTNILKSGNSKTQNKNNKEMVNVSSRGHFE